MNKVVSASAQAPKASAGVTLRHWTTSSLEFVGGRQRPKPGSDDRRAADGCRLNLVAAKLKSIRAEAG